MTGIGWPHSPATRDPNYPVLPFSRLSKSGTTAVYVKQKHGGQSRARSWNCHYPPSVCILLIGHSPSSRFPQRCSRYYQPPSGQSRGVYQATQLRPDDVHLRESVGTGSVILKVARVTDAAYLGNILYEVHLDGMYCTAGISVHRPGSCFCSDIASPGVEVSVL